MGGFDYMNVLQDTVNVLKEAGWHEGRKIDTMGMEEYLISSGYEVFPTVKTFLEEFGMLEINTKNKRAEISGIGSSGKFHHTNPEKAIKGYFTAGSFGQEELYAGEKLVPVGEIDNGYLHLFVSETGKICCETSKLGDNAWEAWDCIIQQRGVKGWGHD